MTVAVDRPLPSLPIRIVDVSPYRSSIRRRSASTGAPRGRRMVAAGAVALAALAAAASVAGAAPTARMAGGDFRLGPGHAMPAGLASSSASGGGEMVGFRLSPGNERPLSLDN